MLQTLLMLYVERKRKIATVNIERCTYRKPGPDPVIDDNQTSRTAGSIGPRVVYDDNGVAGKNMIIASLI